MPKIQPPEKAAEFECLNRSCVKLSHYEKTRKGIENLLKRGAVDEDFAKAIIKQIRSQETRVAREVIIAYRAEVPARIQQWVRDTPGLNEKGMARLLGALGHPVHAFKYAEVDTDTTDLVWEGHRTFRSLRAYCALGKPGRIPKGADQATVFSFGRPELKMRMYLVSLPAKTMNGQVVKEKTDKDTGEVVVTSKTGTVNPLSPYHHVYEAAKKEAVARGWDQEKSKALMSNRADQHAIRMVSKAILEDLYEVSKGTCC